jgi:hypothetical protein
MYALVYAVSSVAAGGRGGSSAGTKVISSWGLGLVIANWVIRDAQKRGRPLCHDYGMFLFFAGPEGDGSRRRTLMFR